MALCNMNLQICTFKKTINKVLCFFIPSHDLIHSSWFLQDPLYQVFCGQNEIMIPKMIPDTRMWDEAKKKQAQHTFGFRNNIIILCIPIVYFRVFFCYNHIWFFFDLDFIAPIEKKRNIMETGQLACGSWASCSHNFNSVS